VDKSQGYSCSLESYGNEDFPSPTAGRRSDHLLGDSRMKFRSQYPRRHRCCTDRSDYFRCPTSSPKTYRTALRDRTATFFLSTPWMIVFLPRAISETLSLPKHISRSLPLRLIGYSTVTERLDGVFTPQSWKRRFFEGGTQSSPVNSCKRSQYQYPTVVASDMAYLVP
jgi:hypothetical protein